MQTEFIKTLRPDKTSVLKIVSHNFVPVSNKQKEKYLKSCPNCILQRFGGGRPCQPHADILNLQLPKSLQMLETFYKLIPLGLKGGRTCFYRPSKENI
jgi:hypothetical protein